MKGKRFFGRVSCSVLFCLRTHLKKPSSEKAAKVRTKNKSSCRKFLDRVLESQRTSLVLPSIVFGLIKDYQLWINPLLDIVLLNI